MTMGTRSDWRRDYPRVVRARCRKCSRVVAELYGNEAGLVGWASPNGTTSGLTAFYGRAVRWRCRCGGDYPIRAETLAAAFEVAAAQLVKRDRVVWLPDQL